MAGCRTLAAVRPSHPLITVHFPVSNLVFFFSCVLCVGGTSTEPAPHADRDIIIFSAACGVNFTSGFTSAVNELAFGANNSYGDACGRCFRITPTEDPFDLSYEGPFGNTIIVKVNNLCIKHPVEEYNWCGQTVSHPKNDFNVSMQYVLLPSRAWYVLYDADFKIDR